ncbi:MAG TPA: acetylxylan esterase [Actinobacteria bacterium]|jgi:cephalosporin-C deacetylase|nr:acetylxylan esterase [Actinomycetota bacterium]
MLVDMSYEELLNYLPAQYKEKDFEDFWIKTLEDTNSEPLNEQIERIDYVVEQIEAFKVYFDGFSAGRICGYYLLPKTKPPFPVILYFHGYGDNKQKINYYLKWLLMGYAVFAIDIRGQNGESFDGRTYPPPSAIGLMTKGVFSKYDYYYRFVYMDCVKAINFLEKRNEIDIKRLCLTGLSQGGGLSLATAALDSRPKLVIAEVPYLCHYRRAVEWAEEFPNVTYSEFRSIIKKYPDRENEMYRTLSYFDNLNLADRIKSYTIVSCAMNDMCTPPSTIFAVYNQIKAKKEMITMPYYGHSWETFINFEEKRLEIIKKYL